MVKALPDILATIVEQKKLDLAVREPDCGGAGRALDRPAPGFLGRPRPVASRP